MSRDPTDWPFLASSIYNMPIGSGAVYAPAGIHGVGAMPFPSQHPTNDALDIWMLCPNWEPERIVMSPASPVRTIALSTAGWSGVNRCNPTGGTGNGMPISAPIPDSFTVPHSNRNEAAAFLMADGLSVRECQPFARCTAAGDGTAAHGPSPIAYSIVGSGIETNDGFGMGAHGGSRLLALGGTIRLGELRPGAATGPTHCLKVHVNGPEVYYDPPSSAVAHRWPATAHDGVWNSAFPNGYGSMHNNTNSHFVPGALLAIPWSVDIDTLGFETEAGWQIAWTFKHFGGYAVDNAGTNNFGISIDEGADGSFDAQFLADYGTIFRRFYTHNIPWTRDIGRVYQQLQIVSNNGPNSVGGGGVPRWDYAPLMEMA